MANCVLKSTFLQLLDNSENDTSSLISDTGIFAGFDHCSCLRCNFESEDQSSVHDHVSSAHPEDLQCSICERVFASPYLVSKHANLSHGGDGRTCRICGRTMSNRKQLRSVAVDLINRIGPDKSVTRWDPSGPLRPPDGILHPHRPSI